MNTNANFNPNSFLIGLLGVLFIALKLTGFIHWSWWWVVSPFWIPLALFVIGGGIAGAVLFIRKD